jgi:glutamine amidotransferase
MNLVIVDYGVGNLGAIPNMLARIGVESVISSDPARILQADRLILPGVGAFDAGMRRLSERGLVEALNRKVLVDRAPVLGLCLGMELLADSSEEGSLGGLGWVPGRVVRFRIPPGSPLRVPHMGWAAVRSVRESPISASIDGARFYFAHTYHFEPAERSDVAGETEYGYPFTSVVHRGNVLGVQFHPEKSHRFGLALLDQFSRA